MQQVQALKQQLNQATQESVVQDALCLNNRQLRSIFEYI